MGFFGFFFVLFYVLAASRRNATLREEGPTCARREPAESLDSGKLPAAVMHTSPSSYPQGILTDGLDWLFTVA